jgi:ribosomal protein L11 methyltransferase
VFEAFRELGVLFPYRIDDALRIGPPWLRSYLLQRPAGVLLTTRGAFPPSHPTTKMCLRLIAQVLRTRTCRTMVDVGCGSGVLALAGLRLGVQRALAVDLCHRAIMSSRANARLNGLENRLLLARGSTESLSGTFDLVVANLPMRILAEKLADLGRLAEGGGSLALSGFQDLDRPEVERILRHLSFQAVAWLNADLSFPAPPPSGSYTWMAVLASTVQAPSRLSKNLAHR